MVPESFCGRHRLWDTAQSHASPVRLACWAAHSFLATTSAAEVLSAAQTTYQEPGADETPKVHGLPLLATPYSVPGLLLLHPGCQAHPSGAAGPRAGRLQLRPARCNSSFRCSALLQGFTSRCDRQGNPGKARLLSLGLLVSLSGLESVVCPLQLSGPHAVRACAHCSASGLWTLSEPRSTSQRAQGAAPQLAPAPALCSCCPGLLVAWAGEVSLVLAEP